MTGQTNPKVVLIGFLCLVLDGFDLQAMSFAAPALSADWKLPRADLGITPLTFTYHGNTSSYFITGSSLGSNLYEVNYQRHGELHQQFGRRWHQHDHFSSPSLRANAAAAFKRGLPRCFNKVNKTRYL